MIFLTFNISSLKLYQDAMKCPAFGRHAFAHLSCVLVGIHAALNTAKARSTTTLSIAIKSIRAIDVALRHVANVTTSVIM